MKQKLKLWPIASLFILCTLLELGSGRLTIKLSSTTEALVGQKIHFNCSTSLKPSEIQWFHYPVQENSQRHLVYGFGKMGTTRNYGRFHMEMDNATGAFNLVIPSLTLDDAGNYECQDDYGRGDKSNAQLIVLESSVCASVTDLTKVIGANNCGIKPDQLLLSCIVQYKGNEPPVMKWRKLGEQTTIDSHIAPTKLSNKIIYNLTMDGVSVDNGSAFECFATRAVALTGCRTKNATIISKIGYCEVCSCSCAGAIFITIFVVILIGAAIAASLYFCYFQRQKEKEKEKYEQHKIMDVVFCLNFIPFFIGAVLGLYWYLRYYRPQKKQQQQLEQEERKQLTQSKDESNRDVEVFDEKKIPEKQQRISAVDRLEQLELKNREQEQKCRELVEENEELKNKIKKLEEALYPSDGMGYMNKPSEVHIIKTEPGAKENRPIVGLAVLGTSLFVSHEKTPSIEVYDSATYVLQRQLGIPKMKDPLDIASCLQQSCLFIIGRLKESSEKSFSHIMKIKLDGEVLTEWESGGNSGRLSTHESNVIVCLPDLLVVREFSHEGKLIRQVRLSPADGFKNLSHAIKLTDNRFVVSHEGKTDKRQRVCLVNGDGNIEKCERWEKTKIPVCLLNDKSRSILVGDKEGRVILLNSNLIFQRKLIEKADDFVASRISFDETEKRLFVARNKVSSKKTKDSEVGQVFVFNVK